MSYIISVTRTDGLTAYLREDMWSASKADATRYPSTDVAKEMGRHFLRGHTSELVRSWTIIELAQD
jgi:hypothetical protein